MPRRRPGAGPRPSSGPTTDRERRRAGLAVRRAVLGDEHVDRALSRAGPLDAAFQDLVTRWAWGEIWSRPGLPRRTRSLVTVAMLVALNRTEELRLHLGAALRNGVTTPEIEELLLHAAAYCGIPAANAAFREAKEVLGDGGQRRGRGPSTRRRLRRRRARGERVGRG